MKTKVLIGGGSGLVGSRLRDKFFSDNYSVKILSRRKKPKNTDFLYWDPSKSEIELDGFNPDVVINLAGAGIADKLWTKKYKEEIISSRINSNAVLVNAIEDERIRPNIFLSASAVGIYGNRGDEILNTKSDPGNSNAFMVKCCKLWEASVKPLQGKISRVIRLRIGLVLSSQGGALPKITKPMSFGIAPYFGNGNQYYPWIHIDDLCNQFLFLIEQSKSEGVFNGVSPQAIPLKEFTQRTKSALHKKAFSFPIPALALKLLMGEMSSVLLNSNRVFPNRFLEEGFQFQFENIETAIKNIAEKNV